MTVKIEVTSTELETLEQILRKDIGKTWDPGIINISARANLLQKVQIELAYLANERAQRDVQ